ncbi:MAG: adaptor protein MecA [Lachnospiraceae bacterium]|nr:adaptor protein MecA [Lachnospiraceae bacterium]
MKIEKLNENQIRCTLSKSDLAEHHVRLQELAYGTDRAKALFRDMMQKASDDVGFEVGDIPLMIEAIPVNPDCLILIITKVEDPEELDTRFSRFTRNSDYESDEYDDVEDMDEFGDMDEFEDPEEDSADDSDLYAEPAGGHRSEDSESGNSNNAANIFDVLGNIVENLEAVRNAASMGLTASHGSGTGSGEFQSLSASAPKVTKNSENYDIYRIFMFLSLHNVTSAATQLIGIYDGENTLFKNPMDTRYYLILNQSMHTADEFNLVCNTLSEYGSKIKTTYAMPYYMAEHFTPIIKRNALQTLAEL